MKRIVYREKKCYAINNIDTEKLDENSEFYIGSVTKLFTAISLLILHQEKKININDTFKKYLDNKELQKVKIIDVMNHKSGIKFMPDINIFRKKYNNATEVYEEFKNEKLIEHKKGVPFYSNLGYIFLGALIEKVTKVNYIDYITLKIINPLKMKHTGMGDTNIISYSSKDKKLSKLDDNEKTFASSAGGLKSSLSDLIKFTDFHKLLSEETLKLIPKTMEWNYRKHEKDSNVFYIGMGGGINGGRAYVEYEYDNNWKCKIIEIKLITIFTP